MTVEIYDLEMIQNSVELSEIFHLEYYNLDMTGERVLMQILIDYSGGYLDENLADWGKTERNLFHALLILTHKYLEEGQMYQAAYDWAKENGGKR